MPRPSSCPANKQKHRLLPLPFLVHAIPHAAANPVPVEPQLTLKNGALRYVGIASMGLFNPYNVVCLEGRCLVWASRKAAHQIGANLPSDNTNASGSST